MRVERLANGQDLGNKPDLTKLPQRKLEHYQQTFRALIFSESFEKGGLAQSVVEIFNALSSMGYLVEVALNNSPGSWTQLQGAGIPAKYYSQGKTPGSARHFFSKVIFSIASYLFELDCLINFRTVRLMKQIDFKSFDVLVIANGGFPGGLNCLAAVKAAASVGCPSIHFVNSLYSPKTFIPLRRTRKILGQLLFSSTVIAPSNAVLESLPVIPGQKYEVIPNPPRKVDAASSGQKQTDVIRLICPAAYLPYKGQVTLLRALALLEIEPDFIRVDFYGSGQKAYLRKLKKMARKLGLNDCVNFHGFEADRKVIYTDATMLILPSLKQEAFGMVLLEAMSTGCIPIGSKVGGIPEVLGNLATELCFQPGNADELSKIIGKILNDREHRKRLGRAAMNRFLEFSIANKFSLSVERVVRSKRES